MTPTDAKSDVAKAIEKAKTDLDVALLELDRIPALNHAAVAFVAHALNNYLTVTDGTLELLKDGLANSMEQDVATWLDSLQHLAHLMEHTVERLLQVSPATEAVLKLEYVDVALLMHRACQYHRRNAAPKRQEIACVKVGAVPLAWADRAAVAVVADNLLSNAVKYSPVGGSIDVEITAGQGGVVCRVRDSGAGLSSADQARLFQCGVTLSAVPTAGESSTGFGLAIASEFIGRMGGRIWCESELGRGACFSFWLPDGPDAVALHAH